MTEQQKLLLKLIKSAITGQSFDIPENANIDALITLSKRQKIENMLFYGLITCGYNVNSPKLSSFNNIVIKNVYIDQKQIFILAKLTELLKANNVDFCVLKGSKLKKLYPKSDMRSMVDIDILVKKEQYEPIKPLISKLGLVEKEESLHEFIWEFQNFQVEFHKSLIPSNNKDFYGFFGDGWSIAKKTSEKSCEYSMSVDDEFVFLVCHIAKHMRDTGIGIKYFVDLWLYMNAYELNEEYLKEKFDELKLYEFYQNIREMLLVWFDGKPSNEKTDYITDNIFGGLVFGSNENHILSTGLVASKSGNGFSGRVVNFFNLMFPDLRHMKLKYPVLEKAPILLPFTYPIRWCEAIFVRKGTIKKYSEELNMQSAENIKDYEEKLKYIGLQYNFDDKD